VVADDSSVEPGELDGPMLYQPIDTANRKPASMVVRVARDPRLVIAASDALVRNLDATVPLTSETVATTIARDAASYNTILVLSAGSSGLAMCSSFVGFLEMMTFAVAQRMKEISIRLALGAGRLQIVELSMRLLVRPLIAGLATGSLTAVLIAVLLPRSHVLVAVNPAEPWPYALAVTLVIATVCGATLIPAMVAACTEPSTYLRLD
jgi:putative ABC transport system permease protein